VLQAVLERGLGRWEAVSECRKIWEAGSKPMSLRSYFCLKAAITEIPIGTFSSVIASRVCKLLEDL
jgi:hypothetical protein